MISPLIQPVPDQTSIGSGLPQGVLGEYQDKGQLKERLLSGSIRGVSVPHECLSPDPLALELGNLLLDPVDKLF